MSMSTNALRPTGVTKNTHSPAYSAYKLRGICARCHSTSYQTANSGHPIFKMVCPDCRAYLAEIKRQVVLRNKQIVAANLASKK